MKHVFLISGKAQSGKNEVASFLQEELEFRDPNARIAQLAFGDLVKVIAHQCYNWHGEKDPEGRHLLQYVGTDLVRARYPAFWAQFVGAFFDAARKDFDFAIIPDARFKNEIATIQDFFPNNTTTIRVNRANYQNPNMTEEELCHSSETQLDYFDFDFIIKNKGNLSTLKELVCQILDNIPDL